MGKQAQSQCRNFLNPHGLLYISSVVDVLEGAMGPDPEALGSFQWFNSSSHMAPGKAHELSGRTMQVGRISFLVLQTSNFIGILVLNHYKLILSMDETGVYVSLYK